MPDGLQGYLPLALVVIALAVVLMLGRRRTVRKQPGPAEKGTTDPRIELRKSMEQLQISLMEFGRDVEGRLDTRIHTLSKLIRDADERIERLEKLAGANHRPVPEAPDLHREIYRLADEGLDKVEIAKRTSVTPGEVELILGLRRKRGQ